MIDRHPPSPSSASRWLRPLSGAFAALALAGPAAYAAPPQVWAGGDNTCAVVNGGAYCWGKNTDGQVGNGTFVAVNTPTAVQGLSAGVTFIVTSGAHSCAIVNGGAYCWGNNDYGQLGNNAGTDSNVPVAVVGLSSGVTSIAVGDLHSCAVHNGAVKCWGAGGVGQLGTGASIFSSAVPVQVSGLAAGATDVTTGRFNSCAIVNGGAQCWGQGDSGEMGNGASTYINLAPVAVSGYGSGVSVLSGGAYFACGIQTGAAKCWGWGTSGRLGGGNTNSSNVPQQVVGLTSGVTAITAGNGNHGCAVAGGAPQCWGLNNAGQLGNPSLPGGSTSPAAVQGLPGAMLDVSAGGLHTCATDDTRIYCWGDNTSGQLGTGNNTSSGTPVLVLTVPPPAANPARLANISTRMQVLTGDDVMIGGFIIGGSAPKTVVVRARGPSLVPFGVANALADPTLTLYSGQTVIGTNDDWTDAANAAALQASGFAPSSGLESGLLVTLNPGAYTAVVAGFQNGTGVGIVEVFEVDRPDVPLANISTRGQVLTGNDVMIGGFIIQGDGPQTVVVRARGPSLVPFGIANALANPTLALYSGQTVVATNDDWGTASNAALIQSTGFAPASPFESAIRITLNPGAYTAIVSGVGGVTGVGIIEVFAQ